MPPSSVSSRELKTESLLTQHFMSLPVFLLHASVLPAAPSTNRLADSRVVSTPRRRPGPYTRLTRPFRHRQDVKRDVETALSVYGRGAWDGERAAGVEGRDDLGERGYFRYFEFYRHIELCGEKVGADNLRCCGGHKLAGAAEGYERLDWEGNLVAAG